MSLRVVLVTGVSGSGKSVALRMLEDLGYTCIDNLPVRFLHGVISGAQADGVSQVAVAIDARAASDLDKLPAILADLRAGGTPTRVIFLDAATDTLAQRYSESRRRHPLADRLNARLRHNASQPASLADCIAYERELLAPLRETEHVIDTSHLTPGQLRGWVRDLVQAERPALLLTLESFAFKHGVPRNADLVFDARCLPNPYYDAHLRALTGRDAPVAAWLAGFDEVAQMVEDIGVFLRTWLPRYVLNTRSYLTVAVGCTGGQHRSVYVVERLAHDFADHAPLLVRHRELDKSGGEAG